MAIVVVILGIVAAVVVPNLSSSDPKKLEAATSEITQAIEFARNEAVRTKMVHGIYIDAANDRLRVYSLPGSTAVYDVYHPIDKMLYDIQLQTNKLTEGIDLISAKFVFNGGNVSTSLLEFNSDGMPKYTSTKDYMLTSAEIGLNYKGQQRTIFVAPGSGRVTVQ